MLPLSQQGRPLPEQINSSHVLSQRLRPSEALQNTVSNINNNNTTETRITNKSNITCSVDEKTNQKSICTQNRNRCSLMDSVLSICDGRQLSELLNVTSWKAKLYSSSRLSSTPFTFSMTTLPAAERARLSVPKESSSDGDISFLTTEQHQQLEKMKHRNVTKKPFFEKAFGETENIVWSTCAPPNAPGVKPLSPNCHLRWSLSQGRESTQLPATTQAMDASYQDPLVGASNTFLLRVNEISSLEAETVRQERYRKLKKKNKLDRDSSGY